MHREHLSRRSGLPDPHWPAHDLGSEFCANRFTNELQRPASLGSLLRVLDVTFEFVCGEVRVGLLTLQALLHLVDTRRWLLKELIKCASLLPSLGH